MTATARILELDRQAQWAQRREQGAEWEGRQPRRIWAVEALKAELLPEEWDAASRAVRDCSAVTGVNGRLYDERTDGGGGSDYGLAAQITACQHLNGLRQAAFHRTGKTRAPHCVEWVVSLWTLPEIARELGFKRRTGTPARLCVDTRPAKPFVRLVLMSMAAYYDECGAQLSSWRRG